MASSSPWRRQTLEGPTSKGSLVWPCCSFIHLELEMRIQRVVGALPVLVSPPFFALQSPVFVEEDEVGNSKELIK